MGNNIKMDYREIRWEGVDQTNMAHQWLALVNMVMNTWVP
jgi:hypothetical protein